MWRSAAWAPLALAAGLVGGGVGVALREGHRAGAFASLAPTASTPIRMTPVQGPLPYGVVWIRAADGGGTAPSALGHVASRGATFLDAWCSGPEDGTAALVARLGEDGLAIEQRPASDAAAWLRTHHAPAAFFLLADGATGDQVEAIVTDLNRVGLASSTLLVVSGPADPGGRMALALALPGIIAPDTRVQARIRSVDVAPTVVEVEGLEADPTSTGLSLLGLARGESEPTPRVALLTRRHDRALVWDHWQLAWREGRRPRLFDLDGAPSRDVSRAHPDVVEELQARARAARAGVPAADAVVPPVAPRMLHLRWVGAGAARHVTGTLRAGDDAHPATVVVEPKELAAEAFRIDGPTVTLAFSTAPDRAVGADLRVDPPGAPVTWDLALDDRPWPDGAIHVGPHGLPALAAGTGITNDAARAEVVSPVLAPLDPGIDLGLFVTRDPPPPVRTTVAGDAQ